MQWIERSAARYPAMYCKINCAAVSDRDGFVSFHVNSGQTGASHITAEGGGDRVRSVTVDDYLDRHNIAAVALLKMDIEGYSSPRCRARKKASAAAASRPCISNISRNV